MVTDIKKRLRPLNNEEIRLVKKLGNRILECAAKRNISIERLAYEAGVSKGYLYDIAKGKGNPSIVILNRISEALDISISALMIF